MDVQDGEAGEPVAPPPEPPLDRTARREILDRAETLSTELPRTLRKARARLSEDALWRFGDLLRALRAHLVTPPRTDAEHLEIRAVVDALDALVEQFLPRARPSGTSELLTSLAIAVTIALFIRTFLFEAFQIPTGSMIPTLLVGDRIFVSKFVYGVPIPFTRARLFAWRAPARGEVVVFQFPRGGPHSGKHFIKRIIAVGGDRVRLTDNRIQINGEVFGEPALVDDGGFCVGEPGQTCSARDLDRSSRLAPVDLPGRLWSGPNDDAASALARGDVQDGCPCVVTEEHAGGQTWITQRVKDHFVCECQRTYVDEGSWFSCARQRRRVVESPQTIVNNPDWPTSRTAFEARDGWGPDGEHAFVRDLRGELELLVPEGHVFVMGDNRDFSDDGRFWGLVPIDRIEGKAWVIWYSSEDPWGRLLARIH